MVWQSRYVKIWRKMLATLLCCNGFILLTNMNPAASAASFTDFPVASLIRSDTTNLARLFKLCQNLFDTRSWQTGCRLNIRNGYCAVNFDKFYNFQATFQVTFQATFQVTFLWIFRFLCSFLICPPQKTNMRQRCSGFWGWRTFPAAPPTILDFGIWVAL